MANKALGLIEVKGYLGAVVAADAAVKAANVSLLAIETIKSGLNTVQLIGDVSAVTSAVEAALVLVRDKPYYLASHVIPRLDEQTAFLFSSQKQDTISVLPLTEQQVLVSKEKIQQVNQWNPPADFHVEDFLTSKEIAEVREVVPSVEVGYSQEDLSKLKVVELRRLAYREETISLSKKEIKFANKGQLIEALSAIERKE